MNIRSKKRVSFDGAMIPLPTAGTERTLGDVREGLRKDLAVGEFAFCLCCGGNAKVYARSISHMMVRALALLAKAPHGLSSSEITKLTRQTGGGDTSRLAHWEMIEPLPDHFWKITPKGRQFLAGDIRVPHKALVYIDKLIGFDTSIEVGVHDVVGKAFDLDEVLAADPVATAVVEVTE